MLWWLRHLFLWFSLSLYSSMAPIGYLGFAMIALVKPGDELSRARLVQRIVRRAFTLMLRWLRFTRLLDFDPKRVPSLPSNGPFIIISNHPSLTDTAAIISLVPDVCPLVRGDLYEQRLLRPLFEVARYLDPGKLGAGNLDAEEVARWMETAEQRLREGFSILIFPEGTRSPPGAVMRRFRRLAFETACQLGAPVLALTVQETPRWLGRGTGFLPLPKAVPHKELAVLKVYNPKDFQRDSRRMRRRVEEDYKSALAHAPEESRPRALSATI